MRLYVISFERHVNATLWAMNVHQGAFVFKMLDILRCFESFIKFADSTASHFLKIDKGLNDFIDRNFLDRVLFACRAVGMKLHPPVFKARSTK